MRSSPPSSILKPPPLRSGDRVGIIAPAGPVPADLLQRGCAALRNLGYEPVYEPSILDSQLYFAGSRERRVHELETMFERDDVQAIVAARGGYGCNYLLPNINVNTIQEHPKIFVGYSDITSLLTWFHDAAGLVTFHGPMLARDFAAPEGVDFQSWNRSVLEGCAQNSGRELTANATLPGLTPLIAGAARGRLYGGCLSLLVASLGTPYEIRPADTILFIEDVAASPYQIDRMLMQLRLAGKLDSVRGICFGIMRDCQPPPGSAYTLVDSIRHALSGLGVPVAFGLNSGHVVTHNITLPIGLEAELVVEQDTAELRILEAAVHGIRRPEVCN